MGNYERVWNWLCFKENEETARFVKCKTPLTDFVYVCFLYALQLAPDDAWRCPHCRQLQQGRIKLSLWTLPDVLILHLKRFRQVLY